MPMLAEAALVVAEHATGAARTAALQQTKEACAAVRKECTYYPYELPHAYRMQGTYAWLQGQPTNAKKWWRRSLRTAEV
jgi:hypothetical protein